MSVLIIAVSSIVFVTSVIIFVLFFRGVQKNKNTPDLVNTNKAKKSAEALLDQKNIQIDKTKIPKHVGIIMDGNGRWAIQRGMPRNAGHSQGVKTLKKISKYCNNIGIKVLTVFAFSTENWNRPRAEVDHLMELLKKYLMNIEKNIGDSNIAVRVIGEISQLEKSLKNAIIHAENVTQKNTGMILNIALNYGGRNDIIFALRAAALDVGIDKIDENVLDKHLMTAHCPAVDLIIRPSGEKRLSNFLLWQAAYAELWFSDINWPDFTEKDMNKAIFDFQNRERRFGAIQN